MGLRKKNSKFKIENEPTILNSGVPILKYAGFGLRLVAFIIDYLLLFFLTSLFWAIIQLPIPINSKSLFLGSFLIFKNP